MRHNIICRDITGCRLECAPWSKYFVKSDGVREFQKDQNPDKKVTNWIESQISNRVILLGAPGSGKTTFIQLVSDQSKFPTENIATDGISINQVNNITFWDFGGQEVLFSTHKFFLVDRCQYILVVDLSKLIHENDKIRNETLKYVDFWMKEIHTFTLNHQHSPPVLFLGTHCDLIKNTFSSKKKGRGRKALVELAQSNHLNCIPKVFTFYKSDRSQTLKNNISGILNQIQTNSEKFILKDLGITNNENNNVHSLQFCILKYNIELYRTNKPFMRRNEFENLFFANESQENIIKYTKLLKVSGIIETYQFESTAASEIIFLDPKWLSQIFTSIVSIQMQSSKNRRGFFTKAQIENNLKSRDISESIWEEIFTIFEMFHLMVVLPSGEYYVPAMLHTPKSSKPSHLGNEKNNLITDTFKEKNIKYKCIRRKYEFSPKIPFEFIDKLIVKYLHFPGMKMHESTWTNDFYLYSTEDGNYNHRFYHLLIQVIYNDENNDFMSTELMISIFYPEYEENNLYFSFFSHFIFQSPHDMANSPNYSTTSIENISILGENLQENPIGDEKNILFNFRKNKDFQKYIIPSDIKVFDSEIHKCKFNEKLGSGGFGQVYSGKMKFDLLSKATPNVVFKETRFVSFESLRNLINECMMMKIVENQFTIKLLGLCIPSMRLLDSRKKIHLSEENNSSNQPQSAIIFANNDEEDYLNHQILMIIEEAPWGDLTHCHEIIQKKNSTKLKLKIAFDVARGLNSLYLKSGVKLIHRDVKSQNIFIISLDENSVSSSDSVHAKLGDFGSIVVASPSYSQRIGNYQYTAPEALRGSFSVPYSREIDVYSFGILFWEILTGKIPFQELKENPNTCNKIEQMIIDGYRPSLDVLPKDIPRCIIDIISDCWNSKPSARPSLGKIISILTIILQLDISNENEIQKYLPSIESSFEMKQKIIGKNIDTSFFSDIQIKGTGPFGLVMICKFHLDGTIYNVALKMVLNFSNSEISPSEHRKTMNEFNVLPQIQQHPNIICIIGSFQCIPSDEMINFVDESIRDLCFYDDNGLKKKKFQFYILEEYEKTLESIILDLSEEKIIKYSLQLSSALLFLFNHNIVHLDLKLDNLMISHNGDLIIVDFGVAGIMDLNGQVQYSQTQGGNMLHLSPEVLFAKAEERNLPCKNQHSWELGMIMFQMFSKGELPFENYSNLFSFQENCIDVSIIPDKYRDFISSLLCPSNERLSIYHAHQFLSQFNS